MKLDDKKRNLDYAVLPCRTIVLNNPYPSNDKPSKKIIEIFSEFIDQTNILLKSKNILFFYEIKNLLSDLKFHIEEKNIYEFQKIEKFLENDLNKILILNESFTKTLEKFNFFDLQKNEKNLVNEVMNLKVDIEYYKNNNENLAKKNENLEFHVNNLLNKTDSGVNSGLKKTIQKVIFLDKKNAFLESKEENFIKQIYLLKEENIKLFVKMIIFIN